MANKVALDMYYYSYLLLFFWNDWKQPSGGTVAAICLAPVPAFTALALCPADHTARAASGTTGFDWVYGHVHIRRCQRFCRLVLHPRRDHTDACFAWQVWEFDKRPCMFCFKVHSKMGRSVFFYYFLFFYSYGCLSTAPVVQSFLK